MAVGMAQGERLKKFYRVTDLFTEGKEVVLDDGSEGGEPVLVWVNKLNAFEQDEARKDGGVGRSRAMLVLDDPESPETQAFANGLGDASKGLIVNALTSLKSSEFYVKALDDIRSDEAWRDKIDLVERGPELMDDGAMKPDEAEAFEKLMLAYDERVNELADERANKYRQDLDAMELEDLREEYLKSYRDTVGSQGFLAEFRVTEIFYALRDCKATQQGENGRWDHSNCQGHRERLLGERADVKSLPDGLLVMVREALTELSIPPKIAGNSDAPASSSASSEQPSAEADSTPSIPVEI